MRSAWRTSSRTLIHLADMVIICPGQADPARIRRLGIIIQNPVVFGCQCHIKLGEPLNNDYANITGPDIELEPGERLILDTIVYPIYQGNIYGYSTSATLDTQVHVSECTQENL